MTLPKYLTLKKTIKDWALSGRLRPGDQIPTEVQLAEQFAMSRQTVRMALNELVHENFLKRYQGRGTFLSETLFELPSGSGSHRLIAVMTTYISDYIFPSIIRGIEARLSEDQYSMLLLNTNNNFEKEAQALDSILTRPVDGVIFEPTQSTHYNPNLRRYLRLLNQNLPLVMLHGAYLELDLPVVRLDDEQGGVIAADHLQQLGHKRIAMISKEDDIQGRLRLRGFLKTHFTNSTKLLSEWIRLYTTEEREDVSFQFVEAFKQARESERPTALVCYNDEVASDLVRRLTEAGFVVPDDLSIVSFDDSQWAQDNGFTSVQHPKYDMGVMVADKILKEIQDRESVHAPEEHEYVFKPNLVVRSSTKNI